VTDSVINFKEIYLQVVEFIKRATFLIAALYRAFFQ